MSLRPIHAPYLQIMSAKNVGNTIGSWGSYTIRNVTEYSLAMVPATVLEDTYEHLITAGFTVRGVLRGYTLYQPILCCSGDYWKRMINRSSNCTSRLTPTGLTNRDRMVSYTFSLNSNMDGLTAMRMVFYYGCYPWKKKIIKFAILRFSTTFTAECRNFPHF